MGLSVEDQLEIQTLVARYNHAVDSGDGAAFKATFVKDGVLDAGVVQLEGHDALAAFAEKFATSTNAPRHVATNLVIEGDGSQATLKAYIHMSVMAGDPPQSTVTTAGSYNDTLVKEGGRWKFVRRTFTRDT